MRKLAVLMVIALIGASCGGSDGSNSPRDRLSGSGETTGAGASIDGEAPTLAPVQGGSGSSATVTSAGGGGSTRSERGSAPGAAPAVRGAGVRVGVKKDSVLFGMHLPQSGAVGALAGRAWYGADAYFKHINDKGGIHGRKFQIAVADDGYEAGRAATAIRQLVDTDKVFAASCLAGVDQCVVGATYANRKGVPYLHAGMSEAAVRGKPWTFPTTQTYPYGGAKMIDYLFQKRGWTTKRKMGSLVLNSQQLSDMVPRVNAQLAKYKSKFLVKEVAEKDQNDFSTTITKFKNAGVDTLWFHIDPTLIAKFTSQARALLFTPTYVFTSPAGGDLFATAAAGALDGAIGVTSIADPEWSGASQFREIFRKYYSGETPDEFNILAFLDAMVFVEAVRRAGPSLGRDSFARGVASIKNYNSKISSTLDYVARGRILAGNAKMAGEEVRGGDTVQVTGFVL